MQHESTRGHAVRLDFPAAMLEGLATDGGLYLPERWPAAAIIDPSATYPEVATEVLAPFVEPWLDRTELAALIRTAYASFDDPDVVVPIRRLSDEIWIAELFHGPTLAFKDLALQLVGELFGRALSERGTHLTVLGATSGDTGSAAMSAVADRPGINAMILYPHQRISEVQRRQMTTIDAPNVTAVAVEGTFDDCQALVKAAFADEAFRREMSLGAVNSINWARVAAQIVYYAWIAHRFAGSSAPSVVVPTGNFGNIFAGWAARRCGYRLGDLIAATNRNDVVVRAVHDAALVHLEVQASQSPSMDIAVSSNFERLLFEAAGRDGARIAALMDQLRLRAAGDVVPIPADIAGNVSSAVDARSVSEAQTTATIARWMHEQVLDPHTAVGVTVAEAMVETGRRGPIVALATAHPAKFGDAVVAAGAPEPQLPDSMADLFERTERTEVIPNDLATVQRMLRGWAS